MQSHKSRSLRVSQILVIAIAVLFLTLLVLIWQKATGKNNQAKDTPASETAKGGTDGLYSSNARKARNVERKNDVSRLLSAVLEYSANNSGTLPAMVFEDQLRSQTLDDTPTNVPDMKRYPTFTISKETYDPIDSDKLILVLSAVCTPANGAVAGSSRQAAALYSLESTDGTYEPACQNL